MKAIRFPTSCQFRLWAGGLLMLLCATSLFGQTGTEPGTVVIIEDWHDNMSGKVSDYGGTLDQYLYSWLDSAPTGMLFGTLNNRNNQIDQFFGDPSVSLRMNQSRVEVSPEVEIKDREGISPSVNFSAKLDLPLAERRLHLFYDNQNGNITRSSPSQNPILEKDKSHVLGLLWDLYSSDEFSTHLQVGVRRIVYPYLKYSMDYAWDLDPWLIIPSQEFYYYADKGFGESTGLECNRSLSSNTLFRASTSGTWAEDSDGYEFGQSASLIRMRNEGQDEAGQILDAGFSGHVSSKATIDNWMISYRYRRKVKWDWLFFEINPAIEFPREHDYSFTPSVKLLFDILFERIPPRS